MFNSDVVKDLCHSQAALLFGPHAKIILLGVGFTHFLKAVRAFFKVSSKGTEHAAGAAHAGGVKLETLFKVPAVGWLVFQQVPRQIGRAVLSVNGAADFPINGGVWDPIKKQVHEYIIFSPERHRPRLRVFGIKGIASVLEPGLFPALAFHAHGPHNGHTPGFFLVAAHGLFFHHIAALLRYFERGIFEEMPFIRQFHGWAIHSLAVIPCQPEVYGGIVLAVSVLEVPDVAGLVFPNNGIAIGFNDFFESVENSPYLLITSRGQRYIFLVNCMARFGKIKICCNFTHLKRLDNKI